MTCHPDPLNRALVAVFVAVALTLSGCSDAVEEPTGPTVTTNDAALRIVGRRGIAQGLNVLVITMDTTRADRLGVYGHAGAQTPNIDALARPGIRFANVEAVAPITLPTHASIFTGLYPPEHGARYNGSFVLDEKFETLAERLGKNGYTTGGFVGAFVLASRFGIAQGFDRFDDDVDAKEIGSAHYPERHAGKVTDAAIRWLRTRKRDRPVFMWVHYFDPHAPYDPRPPYNRQFKKAPYDGEVAFVDAQIGRLLAAFEKSGRRQDMITCLTADHGEGLGDHGEVSHGTFTYEATLAVPMILNAPELFVEETVVDDRIVSQVDIMPTLLDLLGISRDDMAVDGENVFEIGPGNDRTVYFETLGPLIQRDWAPLFGLRRRDDKLIHGPEPEYYELWKDRSESRNLYGSNESARTLESDLLKRLKGWGSIEETKAKQQPLDPETAAQLAALGYGRMVTGPRVGKRENPMRMLPLWHRAVGAMNLAMNGQLEKARKGIEFALNGDPDNAMTWSYAGHIYRESKDFVRSAACFRKSISLNPRADVHGMLAEVEFNRGRMQEGFDVIENGLKVDPNQGSLHLAAAIGFIMIRQYDAAENAVAKALEVDPVNSTKRAEILTKSIRDKRAQ